MTPEELREKITFTESEESRYGIRTTTGRLELSYSITLDKYYTTFHVENCAKEMIKTKIMRSIYGEWQERLLRLYQVISRNVPPTYGMDFIEAERNFLEALNMKTNQNQEHDDT